MLENNQNSIPFHQNFDAHEMKIILTNLPVITNPLRLFFVCKEDWNTTIDVVKDSAAASKYLNDTFVGLTRVGVRVSDRKGVWVNIETPLKGVS